jgi:hypothetical protein
MNQKNPHEINGVRATSLTARTPVPSHFGTSQEGRPAALPGPGFGPETRPDFPEANFFSGEFFRRTQNERSSPSLRRAPA